jgi:hypothetical protein
MWLADSCNLTTGAGGALSRCAICLPARRWCRAWSPPSRANSRASMRWCEAFRRLPRRFCWISFAVAAVRFLQHPPRQRATRKKIKAASAALVELAERYNISPATAAKWTGHETPQDVSHRPHKLSNPATPKQETDVEKLRRTVRLPLDDLVAVVREFISPDVSSSGGDRCMHRHGVVNLRALQARTDEGKVAAHRKASSTTSQDSRTCAASTRCRYLPRKNGVIQWQAENPDRFVKSLCCQPGLDTSLAASLRSTVWTSVDRRGDAALNGQNCSCMFTPAARLADTPATGRLLTTQLGPRPSCHWQTP